MTSYLSPLPIPDTSPERERETEPEFEEVINGEDYHPGERLSDLAHIALDLHEEYESLNLNLLDYLGIQSDEIPESIEGDRLEDVQVPVAGVANTALTQTTEDYEGLRVEGVSFDDTDDRLVMGVDISYKVDEDDQRETDSWNRLVEEEFETYEAMAFFGISESEKLLIRNFVPVAVREAGGFAGFRKNATKTNSPLDRLKSLTLPDIAKVEKGIEQYIDVKAKAEELDNKIKKTDQLIDEIVYELYGLTDKEIEIVESIVKDA